MSGFKDNDYASALADYYESYDEYERLSLTPHHEIERRTTLEYLGRLLEPGYRVLDACAGTGAYCFDFAERGCSVVAGDIVQKNVDTLLLDSRLPTLEATYVGDLCNLPQFESSSFDVVVVLGAHYHLKEKSDRIHMLKESVRLVKPEGFVAVAYLNRHACFTVNFADHPDQLDRVIDQFHKGVKRVFYRSTPQEIEEECKAAGLEKAYNVALDGYSRLYTDQLRSLLPSDFEKYYQWHLETCEDPSILGASVHGLYIGRT